MVNVFLDLLSSVPEHKYYEQLREEAKSVFRSEIDWADPSSPSKLPLLDSAIRESLRLHTILMRGSIKEVMPENGVTLPDGNCLPQGSWLGTPNHSVHMDERFYSNPMNYEPFRFVRSGPQDGEVFSISEGLSDKASEYRKNVSLPTSSDIFMAWGHGRHAW